MICGIDCQLVAPPDQVMTTELDYLMKRDLSHDQRFLQKKRCEINRPSRSLR
jgi:hypothetical protein